MQRRFIYIINPISGTKSKSSLAETLLDRTRQLGYDAEVYPSLASGDYAFLRDLIREKEVTDVVIAGGDGTVNDCVDSLRSTNVCFSILPFGSGNGLALSARIPKTLNGALDVVFNGREMLTDAFMVNNEFACMLCGLGFDARVAHDFANDPRRGLSTYIRQSLKNFISSVCYSFEIETSRKKITTDAFFISIANSNQYGNNFRIAPRASLTDGLLDVVIITKQNKLSVLWHAIRQVGGFQSLQKIESLNEKAGLFYFQTDSLSISNLSMAPLHIDGDPAETSEKISIRVIENCFRLRYPAG